MAQLAQIKQRFWDNSGLPLAGGKVYIYAAGTTTPANSYTDATGLTANAWPVILDSKGEASIWTSGIIKVNVTDSSGVQITGYPVDNVGQEVSANLRTLPINLNGNMQIAQAGTSFAAPASGTYDLDGWRQINTSAAVYTVTQGTGSAAHKLARITTITTADSSVAAADFVDEDTAIEGYDAVQLVGNTFTVSFNAKFPVTGIHCVFLRNEAADRSYVHEINCTVANTWASYSFTVTGGLPTSGTWVYTNSAALRLRVVHMAGSNFTGTPATADTWMTGSYSTTANQVNDCATIGNVWALEDVRIDLGTVVGTDWPSYQENLARCQRYYELVDSMTCAGFSTTIAIGSYGFKVTKRAVPTLTLVTAGSLFGNGGSVAVTSIGGAGPTVNGIYATDMNVASGLTASASYNWRTGSISVSARL